MHKSVAGSRRTSTPIRPWMLSAILILFHLPALADDPARLLDESTQPPDVRFGPLYTAVQSARLFADQKTFADAIPVSDPNTILADWQMQKHQRNFDLRHFIELNFTLPASNTDYVSPAGQSLRAHIDGLWPVLTRHTEKTERWDSLLPLAKPYVVPGGRFREVYYWDSYFTMLGLAEGGHWESVQNMVDNFASQLDRYGHIPNGNRSYYLSRSQPPFFSMMIDLLASHNGDDVYRHYLPQLRKEYSYWMAGADKLKAGEAGLRAVRLPDGTTLNRYWDERDVPRTESWLDDQQTARNASSRPKQQVWRDLRAGAASGWDFSSRWLASPDNLASIRTTSLLPVDLNSLLYHLELTLAKASRLNHDDTAASQYQKLAQARQQAINHLLWDDKQGWYVDYDWQKQAIHPPLTAAALFPLYLQIASQQQADRTATAVQQQLVKPGGLVTSTVNNGQQWDAPNGWAPLQWVAVTGLNYYGKQTLAREIGIRFLTNVQKTYDKEHRLVEKYVVEGDNMGDGAGGEYSLQDGFGWTNGVTLKLLDSWCPQGMTCNNVSDIPALTQTK
ncbi:alpha,alpha-trehalase [Erwinia sp. OLTSP20]|uniref:alpha,alpha-trehalase TreA n=1 Tax=unclassified Erwinia TaxID=2622719 RepID=UPI000C19F48F|nr:MULTISPECIES: alpha,alpha-trehalase TreA [unclassified Erwinia]PIJ50912.1 alpha,alpha-trehalase [Erwinia sp. OAMSP11]PIJ75960.1 alpha,alpha-trehalase [Erwinia sp. OLSSP12]PIJ83594.1 alpha,alpha-trehalase [Erwinia sp. OLCASP19]PIJ87449.1 alpha,alpha-trehalase [Erwinia sp. OLMTSP26]PIJ88998.1 alpha,alpha-trehalase [Erwinia sp. OLMDSP33]